VIRIKKSGEQPAWQNKSPITVVNKQELYVKKTA